MDHKIEVVTIYFGILYPLKSVESQTLLEKLYLFIYSFFSVGYEDLVI